MQSEEEYTLQLSMWIDGTHSNSMLDNYYDDYRKGKPEATKEDFKTYIIASLFPKS